MKRRRALLSPIDALLLLMVLIWGGNYSVVKSAFNDIPPVAFNSLRLMLASLLFLGSLAVWERPVGCRPPASGLSERGSRRWFASLRCLTRREWLAVAALGVIGHFVYQLCFMGGLARTTVSNSSLILGCSPVATAFLTSAVGHERVTRWHSLAAALSVGGIWVLTGGASVSGETLTGDLLTVCAVFCWTVYTVGSRPLLERHSPMVVTGTTMALGTVLYVAAALGTLRGLEWAEVSARAWISLVFSGTFALFVAYLIWHTAVQRIGNLRTSVYSNVLPVVAMVIAAISLGERIGWAKVGGAALIVGGVAITRLGGPAPAATPAEE